MKTPGVAQHLPPFLPRIERKTPIGKIDLRFIIELRRGRSGIDDIKRTTFLHQNFLAVRGKIEITNPFYHRFGLGLGFYDGFFGPGTGSFWTFSLMVLLGYNMVKAVGYTKVMNFTSSMSMPRFRGRGWQGR